MRKDFSRNGLAVFLSYFRPHIRLFTIDMLCAAAVSVIDLVFPIVSRRSMQMLLPDRLFGAFFAVIAALLLAYLLKAFFTYIITVLGHGMGVLVEADMRKDVFTHIEELSFSYFDKNRTGVLMSRVTNDLFDITELAHHGPENLLICTLTILGALIVMFLIRWELALVITLSLPLLMGFTMWQRQSMRKASVEVRKKTAEINAAIESGISGVRTAKAFANEGEEGRKFDLANGIFKTAKKDYYKKFLDEAVMNRHLFDMIDAMRDTYFTAIVTTASRKNVEDILGRFGVLDSFDYCITQEDIHKPKPDPEGFLLAMEHFGLAPADCVIFEDSDVGIEAARASGATVFVADRF